MDLLFGITSWPRARDKNAMGQELTGREPAGATSCEAQVFCTLTPNDLHG